MGGCEGGKEREKVLTSKKPPFNGKIKTCQKLKTDDTYIRHHTESQTSDFFPGAYFPFHSLSVILSFPLEENHQNVFRVSIFWFSCRGTAV